MKCLSTHELNNVLSHGHNSAHCITKITGLHTSTVSHYLTLHPSGGCPPKLSPADVSHAAWLISTGETEMLYKLLDHSEQLPTTLSHVRVCSHLKKADFKVIVKKKCPLLSACHNWMDFATSYRDY